MLFRFFPYTFFSCDSRTSKQTTFPTCPYFSIWVFTLVHIEMWILIWRSKSKPGWGSKTFSCEIYPVLPSLFIRDSFQNWSTTTTTPSKLKTIEKLIFIWVLKKSQNNCLEMFQKRENPSFQPAICSEFNSERISLSTEVLFDGHVISCNCVGTEMQEIHSGCAKHIPNTHKRWPIG